jgi:hypothetical protein
MALILLASSGCAVHRVRADYTGFEKAFADTSNRELLLNLARLQNHDPTYFFKMGQITSQYKMAATLSTTGSYVIQGTTPGGGSATGGGSPGLTYENDPLFQFIPVNDETNAQLLLKQIPAQTFYILYEQGWRIDQLLRLMVDRIEVTQMTNGACTVTTYPNMPPPLSIAGGLAAPIDQKQLSLYATFLRITAVAYGLQKHGDLLLRGITAFVPLDPGAAPVLGDSQKPSGSGTGLPTSLDGVSASDAEKAAEKNFTYRVGAAKGNFAIGQTTVSPTFYLIPPMPASPGKYVPDLKTIAGQLEKDERLGIKDPQVIQGLLAALQDGLTIQGDTTTPDQAANPCPSATEGQTSTHLVLRSLIGVMAAAAQEQTLFDELNDSNTPIESLDGKHTMNPFDTEIPAIERLPVLRIDWKPETQVKAKQPAQRMEHTQPLIELSYRDKDYLIADPKDQVTNDPVTKDQVVTENQYWNRDVFRLIGALTAQVTVDVSKYPIPNILQLGTP